MSERYGKRKRDASEAIPKKVEDVKTTTTSPYPEAWIAELKAQLQSFGDDDDTVCEIYAWAKPLGSLRHFSHQEPKETSPYLTVFLVWTFVDRWYRGYFDRLRTVADDLRGLGEPIATTEPIFKRRGSLGILAFRWSKSRRSSAWGDGMADMKEICLSKVTEQNEGQDDNAETLSSLVKCITTTPAELISFLANPSIPLTKLDPLRIVVEDPCFKPILATRMARAAIVRAFSRYFRVREFQELTVRDVTSVFTPARALACFFVETSEWDLVEDKTGTPVENVAHWLVKAFGITGLTWPSGVPTSRAIVALSKAKTIEDKATALRAITEAHQKHYVEPNEAIVAAAKQCFAPDADIEFATFLTELVSECRQNEPWSQIKTPTETSSTTISHEPWSQIKKPSETSSAPTTTGSLKSFLRTRAEYSKQWNADHVKATAHDVEKLVYHSAHALFESYSMPIRFVESLQKHSMKVLKPKDGFHVYRAFFRDPRMTLADDRLLYEQELCSETFTHDAPAVAMLNKLCQTAPSGRFDQDRYVIPIQGLSSTGKGKVLSLLRDLNDNEGKRNATSMTEKSQLYNVGTHAFFPDVYDEHDPGRHSKWFGGKEPQPESLLLMMFGHGGAPPRSRDNDSAGAARGQTSTETSRVAMVRDPATSEQKQHSYDAESCVNRIFVSNGNHLTLGYAEQSRMMPVYLTGFGAQDVEDSGSRVTLTSREQAILSERSSSYQWKEELKEDMFLTKTVFNCVQFGLELAPAFATRAIFGAFLQKLLDTSDSMLDKIIGESRGDDEEVGKVLPFSAISELENATELSYRRTVFDRIRDYSFGADFSLDYKQSDKNIDIASGAVVRADVFIRTILIGIPAHGMKYWAGNVASNIRQWAVALALVQDMSVLSAMYAVLHLNAAGMSYGHHNAAAAIALIRRFSAGEPEHIVKGACTFHCFHEAIRDVSRSFALLLGRWMQARKPVVFIETDGYIVFPDFFRFAKDPLHRAQLLLNELKTVMPRFNLSATDLALFLGTVANYGPARCGFGVPYIKSSAIVDEKGEAHLRIHYTLFEVPDLVERSFHEVICHSSRQLTCLSFAGMWSTGPSSPVRSFTSVAFAPRTFSRSTVAPGSVYQTIPQTDLRCLLKPDDRRRVYHGSVAEFPSEAEIEQEFGRDDASFVGKQGPKKQVYREVLRGCHIDTESEHSRRVRNSFGQGFLVHHSTEWCPLTLSGELFLPEHKPGSMVTDELPLLVSTNNRIVQQFQAVYPGCAIAMENSVLASPDLVDTEAQVQLARDLGDEELAATDSCNILNVRRIHRAAVPVCRLVQLLAPLFRFEPAIETSDSGLALKLTSNMMGGKRAGLGSGFYAATEPVNLPVTAEIVRKLLVKLLMAFFSLLLEARTLTGLQCQIVSLDYCLRTAEQYGLEWFHREVEDIMAPNIYRVDAMEVVRPLVDEAVKKVIPVTADENKTRFNEYPQTHLEFLQKEFRVDSPVLREALFKPQGRPLTLGEKQRRFSHCIMNAVLNAEYAA